VTPSSMRPEVCPARTEACPPEAPALGAGLMTPPSTRPEVCPARTEPRPPDTGRPPDERPAAYVVRCACAPGLDGTRGGTVVDHVRLFPLRPGVRLTYRVHEQILPSLKRAKIPVRWTDLIVQHRGLVRPEATRGGLCLDGVERTTGDDGPRRPGARIRPGLVSGR
jgi:hypothetical protein